MAEAVPAPTVDPVSARDSEVTALLDALTSELALGGYAAAETFGYLQSATSLCMERRCKPGDGGRTARTVENPVRSERPGTLPA
jgi:hypothetical protein